MAVRVIARVRKMGNSMAIVIPARKARQAGIREGQLVDATIETKVPDPLGLLADRPFKQFRRREGGLWRDRL